MEPGEIEKAIAQFKALVEKPLPVYPSEEVMGEAPTAAPPPEEAPPGPPGTPGPCLDPGIRDLMLEFIGSLPVCEEVT